jgi:hypothetical protein
MLRSIPETSNWKAVIENLKAQDEADLTKEKVARVLTERAAELATKQVKEQTTELTLAVNSPSHTICYQSQCGKTVHIARFCRSKGSRQKTKSQYTAFGGASKLGKNSANESSDFDTKSDGSIGSLCVSEVYYAPGIKANILSTVMTSEKGLILQQIDRTTSILVQEGKK